MGHLVGLVPAQLLGEEPADTGELRQLGEGGRVAEGVRQPDLLGLDAQLLPEEPLAVHDLPGQRLTARHVGVGLHPHRTHGRPIAVLHGLLDALPDVWLVLLHPGVLLGLRAGEDQFRVVGGQRRDVGEGPGRLADRLAQRPQPRRVDVRVPGPRDTVRARRRGPRQDLRQLGPCRRRRAGDIVQIEGVEHVLQRAQDLVPPRPLRIQLVHQLGEHLDVEDQMPHVLVEYGEVGSRESVDRPIARGQYVSQTRGLEAVQDGGVGRRLQQQMHRLASPRR